MDTIVGKGKKGAIITIVERKTSLVYNEKLYLRVLKFTRP